MTTDDAIPSAEEGPFDDAISSAEESPLVRTEVERGVATLTLDSPHNRNALSTALIDELLAALTTANDDANVRVIVLSHTGPVFCSGADLRETAAATSAGEVPVSRLGDVLAAIWESRKPVVARVGGPARAGGIGLVAAADIAVCDEQATFAFTEVRLGVIPAVISATVLPRLSPRAATELFLTGDVFDGVRAAQIGLVSAAVPAVRLDAAVAEYTAALARGAPGALAAAKRLVQDRLTPGGSLRAQLTELTEVSVRFFTSAEGREGVAAFAAKRPPAWVIAE
jgi:methylglutaconyl-CoA hydratase